MIPADVYLRVSSKDGRQDEANQEPDCERLCSARGFAPTWFRERESGAKHRPEWDRVLERARTGHSRAVVFWSVDRVGRTRVQVMKDLWELARTGVAVVSCRERIVDIPAAGADASPLIVIVREQAIGWLTFMAEDERRKLIDRTHAGLARARAQGKTFGRPRSVPLDVAARAIELRRPGVNRLGGRYVLSWSEVCAELAREGRGSFTRTGVATAAARLSQKGRENGETKSSKDEG